MNHSLFIFLLFTNTAAFFFYGSRNAMLRFSGRLALIVGGASGTILAILCRKPKKQSDVPLMFCIVWLIIHAALIWLYTDALMHVSLLLILLIMNLSAFIAYAADKAKATRHAWRIRESALIILTVSGGSLGAFAAMTLFRHKISDMPFVFLVPLMTIIHAVILICLC